MKKSRAAMLAAGALVLGLVVGGIGLAVAAEEAPDTAAEAVREPGQGPRFGGGPRDGGMVDVVAELTGLTTDEVIELKRAGTSFAKIAEDNGVDSDTLIEAVEKQVYDAMKERLGELEDEGKITQDQVDWALEDVSEHVGDRVMSEGTRPGPRGGFGPCGPPAAATDG